MLPILCAKKGGKTYRIKASSVDSYMYGEALSYSGARDATAPCGSPPCVHGPYAGEGTWKVGQVLSFGFYRIYRAYVYFDTSSIKGNILSAKLWLKQKGWEIDDWDFDVVIQSGMPTYPHNPTVAGDYDRTKYSGDGGSKNTSEWYPPADTWKAIDLNATGIGWINVGGETKFCLRSSKDIDAVAPSGTNTITFGGGETAGDEPYLEIVTSGAASLLPRASNVAIGVGGVNLG